MSEFLEFINGVNECLGNVIRIAEMVDDVCTNTRSEGDVVSTVSELSRLLGY